MPVLRVVFLPVCSTWHHPHLDMPCMKWISEYIHVQLILIIWSFWIREFANLLKFTGIPKINTYGSLQPFVNMCRVVKKRFVARRAHSRLRSKKMTLGLPVPVPTLQTSAFRVAYFAHVFTFWCFLSVILMFQMALKCNAEVLSNKCKKLLCAFRRKYQCLIGFFQAWGYSAVGLEFRVSKPTIYIK